MFFLNNSKDIKNTIPDIVILLYKGYFIAILKVIITSEGLLLL